MTNIADLIRVAPNEVVDPNRLLGILNALDARINELQAEVKHISRWHRARNVVESNNEHHLHAPITEKLYYEMVEPWKGEGK